MVSPYRPLPPLGTLRTFEAVARHLSFTMAATDMALTQSAVSHQIRALEDHLGARLFQRRHRGIEMTAEGRTFLEGVRAGLDSILLATERIRNQHRGLPQNWGSGSYHHWRVWIVGWLEFLSEAGTERAVVDGTADL
jgi:LysR family transcriptional regulator, glycine cleavage system transcriptional activator